MRVMNILKNHKVILASKSPRRQNLLKGLNIDFEIRTKEIDEIFPDHLYKEEIPIYLSELKANTFLNDLKSNELVLTSDTIVWLNEQQIGKPKDKGDSKRMLMNLSGNMHEVITAVTLTTKEKQHSFFDITKVFFKDLTEQEIDFYIENYKPFDKAGSYGIQEWIGYIGIEKIEGCFFNVMGLPLFRLNKELYEFLNNN